MQWSPSTSQPRRDAIGELLATGGRLRYSGSQAVASDSRPVTVIVRGRWTRSTDHETQTEILRKAIDVPDLTSLSLQLIRLSASETEMLKQFPHIRSLQLERVRTQDFSWLESMQSLESISISRMNSDAVLQHVAQLPRLRSVSANYVTDAGGQLLSHATNLESIWFRNSSVGNASIASWVQLDRLSRLRLESPNVTNDALPSIGQMRALNMLSLERARIDNVGLDSLSQLNRLQFLGLVDTNVTTAAFSKLASIRQLQTIRFVTRELDEDRIDLLDYTINTFWDEFSDETNDNIKRMVIKFFQENPHPQEFSLGSHRVDANAPELWIDELLHQLKPVLEFCRELPDCRLR